MIDIRIVCTRDAMKMVETLTRLLEAEQHVVRLSVGRQAYNDLHLATDAHEAVLMVWSPAAAGQEYMLEWAARTPPVRLAELAKSPNAPKIKREAAVIDFTAWRGERGGRAWNSLNERLRVITRALEPPKPPPQRAAMMLGLASVVAVGGALAVRLNEGASPVQVETAEHMFVLPVEPGIVGVGGAELAIEPPSEADLYRLPRPPGRLPLLQPQPTTVLISLEPYEPMELREPTLLERLQQLNPLRSDDQ